MKLENELERQSEHSASHVGQLCHRDNGRDKGKLSLILVAVTVPHALSNF